MKFEITSTIVPRSTKKAVFKTDAGQEIKTQTFSVMMKLGRFDCIDDIYNEHTTLTIYIEKTLDVNTPDNLLIRDRIFRSKILRLSVILEKQVNYEAFGGRTLEPFELFAFDAQNGWVHPVSGTENRMILEHIIRHYGR